MRLVAGTLVFLSAAALAAADSWQVLETQWVRTLHHQHQRAEAVAATRTAEQNHDRIIQSIGAGTKQEVEIVLCATKEEFRAWTGGGLPDWGIGCALLEQNRIVLSSSGETRDRLPEIIVHELAHLVLHQATAGQMVPRWFHEGVAMWQSQEWSIGRSIALGVTMTAYGVIPLERMDSVFSYAPSKAHQAYTQSFLAIAYLHQKAGPDAVPRLVEALREGASFNQALEATCGCSVPTFLGGWKAFVLRKYGALSLVSSLFSAPHFWVGCAALFLAVYFIKRSRSKRTLRQWEEEEQLGGGPNVVEFPGATPGQ